jgi:hypothetical protein
MTCIIQHDIGCECFVIDTIYEKIQQKELFIFLNFYSKKKSTRSKTTVGLAKRSSNNSLFDQTHIQ